MQFDSSLRDAWQSPTQDGVWHSEVPRGWMQGRSAYGGLSTALAVALGYRSLPEATPQRQLRTLHTLFLRPVLPGPIEGKVRVLRKGRSVSFIEVSLLQEEQLRLVVNLVFVAKRSSKLNVEIPSPLPLKPVETIKNIPLIKGITPQFLENLEMRFASGNFPFSGSSSTGFAGYCRFKSNYGDAEGLIALLDAWPSPSLSLLKGPAPASSVSWSAHVLQIPKPSSDWLIYHYKTIHGQDSMHTCVGTLFDTHGTALAYSEQLVAVFD